MELALFKLLIFTVLIRRGYCNFLKTAREQHRSLISTNNDFRYLASLNSPNYINRVLDNILIPRVVGTDSHEKVFKYISSELRHLNWHVEVDEFTEKAPIFGNLKFKNIIATPNPQASRFLVLACHYDSKYYKDVVFVGATDSAVPCAMMLEIAKTLNKELDDKSDVSLKLVFFDGEEAFENWGPKDSIYGARHLAKQLHSNSSVVNGEMINELDRFDMLVLLDLIGMKNPNFMSFFQETQQWFVRLAQIEYDLHHMKLLKNHRNTYFRTNRPFGRIDDDHVPFMKKNVPILHIISTPFPPEWHTPKDNRDIIDMDTVLNINLILKAFISEYLHLINDTKNEEIITEQNYDGYMGDFSIPEPQCIVYEPFYHLYLY